MGKNTRSLYIAICQLTSIFFPSLLTYCRELHLRSMTVDDKVILKLHVRCRMVPSVLTLSDCQIHHFCICDLPEQATTLRILGCSTTCFNANAIPVVIMSRYEKKFRQHKITTMLPNNIFKKPTRY